MRTALAKGWVKANLSIPGREAAKLDFLRAETEASSDSEVIRQALRHLEQLVEDEKNGITLKTVGGTGEAVLPSARFRDRPEEAESLERRSLILHEQSARRLEKLRVAMDTKDVSEVVRCALRFYEELVSAAVRGAQFFAVMPSGEKLRVRFGSFAPAGPTGPEASDPTAHQPEPPGHERPGGSRSSREPLRVSAGRNR
jgi:Arc/MetJ-type ribon-helix-helix transcriptional regulator